MAVFQRCAWFAALGLTLLLAALVLAGATASAQLSAPAVYYGTGLAQGDAVEASIGGRSCVASTADGRGEWLLVVPADAACAPRDGDRVEFAVNGARANETASWALGAIPSNVERGITLTRAASASPSATASAAASKAGTFLSGEIPHAGGFGLVVFGGGTTSQLLDASGCPRATAAFYVTAGARFVSYIPGALVGEVNAAWNTRFADGLPAGIALIGRCR